MDNELRREIIMDNYMYPYNKEVPENKDEFIKVNSNNESCIDEINLMVKVENGIIKDARFDGEACAICTSSTSIMIHTIIGKTIDEAINVLNNFKNMIDEKEYDRRTM